MGARGVRVIRGIRQNKYRTMVKEEVELWE